MHQNKSMYITNVEKEGPFLKVWGQTDKKSSLEVEEALLQASVIFEEGKHMLKPSSLEVGVLCCAKYVDGKYYRARITSTAVLSDGLVEVNFLDYGNKDIIPITSLRSPECFHTSFISLPPLSTSYILAEAVCSGGEWNDQILEQISKEIRYIEVNYVVVAQAIRFYFIRIFIHDVDLGLHLVRQRLMQNTSIQIQEAVLLAMIPRSQPQPIAPPNQSLLQYKSFTLEPNSRHEVYVSYITDGPCHFSVQLKKYETSLAQLMREINSVPLKPLDELPIPGTVCLAKCVEDNHICRAVVTSEVDSQYKLFYVDFGNTELVPPENLYQMAFKYIIPKIMAIRLALDGVDKSTMTLEMQCAFKQFVDNRLLMMEVLPAPKKMALPKCRMWDPDTNTDVIEVLNRAAKCAYPDPVSLHKGFTQAVKVSFVFSCNRFFVQLKSKELELEKLMEDLQLYCNLNHTPNLDAAKLGQPCCALFSYDQLWYRSQIVEIDANMAKVRYIDYGNEDSVPIETLKVIEGEYLSVLKPQAIECCLNGYQNMEADPNLDTKLEELILEGEFTMRVIDNVKNKTLVDLTDSNGATVSALLLETIVNQGKMLTTPTSEKKFDFGRSPNAEDDRSSKPYFQHDNRRPARSPTWKDKTNETTSWRQNSRKRSDSNSNESTESWRQENRGFRNRKENDWNERSRDNSKKEGGYRGRKTNFIEDERPQRAREQNGEQGSEWSHNKPARNQNGEWGSRDDGRGPRKPRNQNDEWGTKEDDRGSRRPRSQNDEWSSKEDSRGPRQPRNQNDEWGGKEDDRGSRKPRAQNDEWGGGNNDERGSRKPRNQNDEWGAKEDDRGSRKPRGQNDEWGGGNDDDRGSRKPRNQNFDRPPREDNWNQNKPPRNQNEDSWNQNKTYRKNDENKDDNWGNNDNNEGFKGRNKTSNDEWNSKNSRDGDWSEKRGNRGRNGDEDGRSGYKGNSERKFGDRGREPRDNDGFKSRSHKREGSEVGSSGSEKSFGKGFRTSSRNDTRPPRFQKKFDNNKNSDNSWSVSDVPSVIDSAPNDAKFKTIDVVGRNERVTISWFHNPCNFFCQLVESQETFKTLMQNIQEAYKGRAPGSSVVGAPAIGLFPEDNVLYRAIILEVIGNQYKIHYVDFGNVSIVDKVWPIENKFMELPMQAIPCGLGGIEPVDGDWPNPDNFSQYFEREDIECNFVVNKNGKYLVTLSSESQDVSQQLLSDGLAKCSAPEVPVFEIALLVGQQFQAVVKDVKDLSDFNIMLVSGTVLNCIAHNLENATEKDEDLLKQQEDQIIIVYADNLVNERLEVTLYDISGNKLNLVSPDEEAFDTVEPLCPYLVTCSTIYGFVSHVNETSVVIQPSDTVQNLEEILGKMYEHYEALPPLDTPIIPEDGSIYSVKSSDGNWYRGRVTAFDDEKATVVYLDYGNSEEVPFSMLRELDPSFLMWHAIAILVNVTVPTADFQDQDVSASIYYGESGWEGEIYVVETTNAIVEVAPVVEQSVEPPVESAEVVVDPPQNISEVTSSLPSDETAEAVVGHDESAVSSGIENEKSDFTATSVILSHIDSPSDFYIQLVDSQDAINELQLKLQDSVDEMTQLESASVGGLCAAPYSVDQLWYRSQILDADDDITTVRFIDFGNTDVIDNKTTPIKTLPPDLLSLEEYATRCRLKIKPNEEEWSVAATDRFEELTAKENITVQFIDQDEKTNYVELYSDGVNVKDVMISEKLAVLDDTVVEGKLTGFLSHMNSPSEFWVQLESCCAELEWIAEQLSNASTFPDLEDLTPGSLCAAMFPDDEMWYRARILSNTVAGIEVLFIDYGNSCVCSCLKQLPEHLVMAQPLALKCSLQKPEGLLNWSAEAARKFTDLSAYGQTVFTVKKLSTGETAIVELFVNGEDVANKLLPNTDNGYVTDIESIESFTLSQDAEPSAEKFKLEKIPGAEYNEESLRMFTEIADKGKTCFNVEYLAENTVRLYLNGSDIRIELKRSLFPQDNEVNEPETSVDTIQAEQQMTAQPSIDDVVKNQVELDDGIGTSNVAECNSQEVTDEITEESKEEEQLNDQVNVETETESPIADFDTSNIEGIGAMTKDDEDENAIQMQSVEIENSQDVNAKDSVEQEAIILPSDHQDDGTPDLTGNELEDVKLNDSVQQESPIQHSEHENDHKQDLHENELEDSDLKDSVQQELESQICPPEHENDDTKDLTEDSVQEDTIIHNHPLEHDNDDKKDLTENELENVNFKDSAQQESNIQPLDENDEKQGSCDNKLEDVEVKDSVQQEPIHIHTLERQNDDNKTDLTEIELTDVDVKDSVREDTIPNQSPESLGHDSNDSRDLSENKLEYDNVKDSVQRESIIDHENDGRQDLSEKELLPKNIDSPSSQKPVVDHIELNAKESNSQHIDSNKIGSDSDESFHAETEMEKNKEDRHNNEENITNNVSSEEAKVAEVDFETENVEHDEHLAICGDQVIATTDDEKESEIEKLNTQCTSQIQDDIKNEINLANTNTDVETTEADYVPEKCDKVSCEKSFETSNIAEKDTTDANSESKVSDEASVIPKMTRDKKTEFHEKILESFSAPTVSESATLAKISPTKVTPKSQSDTSDV